MTRAQRQQGSISIKEALRQQKPRHQRPTACIVCGGELRDGRPAYCSLECAAEGHERHRKGR